MILDLDAGNSRIKWRLPGAAGTKSETGVIASIPQLQEINLGKQLPAQVRVASVRGESWDVELARWLGNNWGLTPQIATVSRSCAGVTNHYQDSTRLGVDRWLAMLAAYGRGRGACVVADCGTALTVDVLLTRGDHQGGYIVPGLATMRESLFANTRIPRFADAWTETAAPGHDTVSAINNGILASLTGLIVSTFNNLQQENSKQVKLYLTGGDADKFVGLLEARIELLELVPDLVLEGLDLMFPIS